MCLRGRHCSQQVGFLLTRKPKETKKYPYRSFRPGSPRWRPAMDCPPPIRGPRRGRRTRPPFGLALTQQRGIHVHRADVVEVIGPHLPRAPLQLEGHGLAQGAFDADAVGDGDAPGSGSFPPPQTTLAPRSRAAATVANCPSGLAPRGRGCTRPNLQTGKAPSVSWVGPPHGRGSSTPRATHIPAGRCGNALRSCCHALGWSASHISIMPRRYCPRMDKRLLRLCL